MTTENTENQVPSSRERYLAEPAAGDALYESGWRHYMSENHPQAQEDFRRALELSPNHPAIFYALGLTLQASGQKQEAIQAFQKVVSLIENPPDELRDRATIMTRLANGHISRMTKGEWDMKDEDLDMLDESKKDPKEPKDDRL